jgi:hypothetical protein
MAKNTAKLSITHHERLSSGGPYLLIDWTTVLVAVQKYITMHIGQVGNSKTRVQSRLQKHLTAVVVDVFLHIEVRRLVDVLESPGNRITLDDQSAQPSLQYNTTYGCKT